MNMPCCAKSVFSLIICSIYFASFSQTNMLINGNFESDSGWNNLGIYNGGEATGKIEGGAYLITITRPGQELWSVQLTQQHINLQKNVAYVLSFDVSASLDRTIEVTVSRNGGDYISYSGKDTLSVSPTEHSYYKRFIMKQEIDNEARLEFNCGRAGGTITIRNVSLVRFTEKVLEMETPKGNESIPSGSPYAIAWSGVNLTGHLSIEVSSDNGAHWKTIASVEPDSSPFIWTPEGIYSPWCHIRIVCIDNPQIVVVNKEPFEIVPQRELIKNGFFADSVDGWVLSVTDAKVEQSVSPYGGYVISIIEKGNEDRDIRLSQDNLLLINGVKYRCSFIISAQDSSVIKVNIGMSRDPYTSYLDSTERSVQLSLASQRYSLVFTMNAPTDSNARFELNFGKAGGTLFFDEVSVVPEYVAPVTGQSVVNTFLGTEAAVTTITLYRPFSGHMNKLNVVNRGYQIFDLCGRLLYTEKKTVSTQYHSGDRFKSAGVYIVKWMDGKKRMDEE